jgi:predicted 2-oxoglutarate/Fe(II)-dependent dioxygenase YbiX
MDTLDKYIKVFDNLLSPSLCNSIVSEYKDDSEWEDARLISYSNTEHLVDKSIRCVQQIGISANQVIEKNKIVRSALDSELFSAASKVISNYNTLIECRIEKDSGYDLLRYDIGGFYKMHTDSATDIMRTLSCSFSLNDDYEGGEWGFWDREITIKLPKGAAILFPSNFMYPHEIMSVTKGTRYSVITWFI